MTRRTTAREVEAAKKPGYLRESVGACEWCRAERNGLEEHEILRGPMRRDAMGKPFAQLLLCHACHGLMGGRTWAEQLAILRRSRPTDYNLKAFHALAKRCKPDEMEVRMWLRRMGAIQEW